MESGAGWLLFAVMIASLNRSANTACGSLLEHLWESVCYLCSAPQALARTFCSLQASGLDPGSLSTTILCERRKCTLFCSLPALLRSYRPSMKTIARRSIEATKEQAMIDIFNHGSPGSIWSRRSSRMTINGWEMEGIMFDSEFMPVIGMGEAHPVSLCDVVRDFLQFFSHRQTFPWHLIIPCQCQSRINKQTLWALCLLSVHPKHCSSKRNNRSTEASLTAILS